MRWTDQSEAEIVRRLNMTPAERARGNRRLIAVVLAMLTVIALLVILPTGPPEPGFPPTTSTVSP